MVTNSFEYKNFMQSPRRLKMHLEGLRFLSFKFFSRGQEGKGRGDFYFILGFGCVPNVLPSGSQGVPELFLKMFPT